MPVIKLQPQLAGSRRQRPDPGSNKRGGCRHLQVVYQVVGVPNAPHKRSPKPGTQKEGARGGAPPRNHQLPLAIVPGLGGTQLGAGLAHVSVIPFWLVISSKFGAAPAPLGLTPLIRGSEESPQPVSSSWLLLKASQQQTRESATSPPSRWLPQGAQKGWSF